MKMTAAELEPTNLNEALLVALARARAAGHNAYQVAARAEVHPSELSRWAHGRRRPSHAQANRIAKALGCDVADIFPRNESSPAGEPGSTKTAGAGGGRRGS